MKDKLIIAHRGASAYAKDNTLDSFSKAIQMGADMIEFDVRRTLDGILIAQHDPTIQSKRIADTTYADIKTIDSDIPTYEEVLKFTRGKIKLDIELKDTGYEKEAADLVLTCFDTGDFIITSFKSRCLEVIKSYNPKIKLGLILGQNQSKEGAFPIKQALNVGADYLMLEYKLASENLLKSARESGLEVMVWTVNTEYELRTFLANHLIDGVISNYPDIAMASRNG
ncbi:MAG: glycerophosphodiester phosphodiesterase [Chloroflexi bacterium]|jgi:glycerophosphoryl diester phosphodiesterase|nr:glycerophosphodiester phosphodiesterase [Chloroflexota bacterium]MBT7079945.1 glycerophosphodiester phosphodiesterase [Chloroflexota bacterium]MBT7290237.1 glycerophosphodiester phosphodiesterase [Chloroflexota bacterium]